MAPAHMMTMEMPKSGTSTPDLPPPPHCSAPISQTPSSASGIRRGLGQVDDAAMKEDTNPATRPEGRREERDEWQRWRRRRYKGGGGGTSKTTTITARKQTTRKKKNK